uniref:Uncharacterized protein n=1 Tax=Biomphalaria glabrata TaxID=6526 RepID=A0A2C9KYU7_BIOGL
MSDFRIAFCVLCGLPAAGKTSFLNFVSTLLIGKNKTNSSTAKSIISEETGTDYMKVVGIHYDIVIPYQVYQEQSVGEQPQQAVKIWKNSRQDVLLLMNVLIHGLLACAGKRQFYISQPEGNNDDLWKRFVQLLQPLATSWEPSVNKVLIVIDDNMHLRSMRYEYYKLAREYGVGYCQIFLDIELDKALERNIHRTGVDQVSEDVITKMAKTLEVPDPSKNSWEKLSLTISDDVEIDWDLVISFIKTAFLNAVQPVVRKNQEESATSRSQCSSSVLHQADLILRKCVSSWLAENKLNHSLSEFQQCVKHANHTKESILSKLHQGDCDISVSLVAESQNAARDPQCLLYKFIEDLFLTQIKTKL